MARLTLRLPETLHQQLEAQAESEGVSLNQYIVCALTRQITTAYSVQTVPEKVLAEQRAQYSLLLQSLGQASFAQIEEVMAEREPVEPEPGLTPEVVTRLRERIASKT